METSLDLDVIGIGAVLHDFVFTYRPGRDEIRGQHLDQGPEYLDGDDDEIAQRIIRRFHQDPRVTVQVGGSSYLAIKTISYMHARLRVAYVGVWGAADELER